MKGSTTTISCVITGMKDTATVVWSSNTGEVTGEEFKVVRGSNVEGTQTSTLAVDGNQVNVDAVYTCRVNSSSIPDTAVYLNVFGMFRSVKKEIV